MARGGSSASSSEPCRRIRARDLTSFASRAIVKWRERVFVGVVVIPDKHSLERPSCGVNLVVVSSLSRGLVVVVMRLRLAVYGPPLLLVSLVPSNSLSGR